MKVVEGDFGGEADFHPMGEVLLEMVQDPFIKDIREGNFVLIIDSLETGRVVLNNTDTETTVALLELVKLTSLLQEMEDYDDGETDGA